MSRQHQDRVFGDAFAARGSGFSGISEAQRCADADHYQCLEAEQRAPRSGSCVAREILVLHWIRDPAVSPILVSPRSTAEPIQPIRQRVLHTQ